jgi:acetyl esterase
MPLHLDAAAFMKQREAWGVRPTTELSVEEAREQTLRVAKLMGAGEPVAKTEDHTMAGPHGDIPLRIYTPQGSGPFPVLVFYHGGGWVVGNLDSADMFCRLMTNAAGCVVVSVNYHHAPEHKFPMAADDAYAGAVWAAQNAATFNGDATRLAVSGSSAGGNLAAVVAQMARDTGTPAITFQLLIVPVCAYNFDTNSYRVNADGYGLTTDAMKWYWRHYLRDEADGANPYASPLRAKSLKGLPPAFVATAEFDPLCDEGNAYAARLKTDGVPTQHRCYEGMIHGFLGAQANADMVAALRQAFAK